MISLVYWLLLVQRSVGYKISELSQHHIHLSTLPKSDVILDLESLLANIENNLLLLNDYGLSVDK